MDSKRAFAIPAVALAAALVFAACGGGEPFSSVVPPTTTPAAVTSSTAQTRLLASVQRATVDKTARLGLDMSMSGLGAGGAVHLAGSGVIDFSGRAMQMTVLEQGSGPARSIEVRLVGGIAYVKTGAGWTSQLASATSADTPMPSNYLDFLQGVAGDVRLDGHDTLHGVATTRYVATLDLQRALTRIHDLARRAIVQQVLDAMGLTKVPARVWLDTAGRLRKLELSFDLRAATKLGAPAGSDPKIVESFEFYDFGIPVDVQAPSGAVPVGSAQVPATESDLRNALTAEKVAYTDNQRYTADISQLKQIEPSLDWGNRLSVFVGRSGANPAAVVCMSQAADGNVYSIADIASGPLAGTYYGRRACPRIVEAGTVATLKADW